MSEDPDRSWQPIATAPTIGTILLWWKGAGACTGSFAIDEDWTPKSSSPREGWKGDADDGIPCNQEDCTHWMLLPKPPAGHTWPTFAGRISEQESLRAALAFRARYARA